MARPSTKEAASQTDVISQAAQREGAKPGHKEHKKGREHHGCCSCKRFSILVALLAIAVGVYRKQAYIAEELLPGLDPYLDPVRRVLPDDLSEHVTLVRNGSDDAPRPGLDLYKQGHRPKFPVVVVPGFVTSGLELWKGHECAKKYFRQRIWGSLGMTRSFFSDIRCWMTHMALDEKTGMDPEGVRLRAAAGLEAVDFFMPGYHVWAKIIEALADVGYDANSIIGETYDWRLGVPLLEVRDGYFTRLKRSIELAHQLHDEKVLVISHSWGDNVFRNFLLWAATEADDDWTEKHIAHYANIAGPTLGVPKSVSSFLSGETRDTAELGYLAAIMSDHMIPRNERVRLFRTWGAGVGMLPVGGPDIWGNASWAPDDPPEQRHSNSSFGSFLTEYRVNRTLAEKAEAERSSLQEAVMGYLRTASMQQVNELTAQHDIAGAVQILLDEAGPGFAERVHLYGAVHVDKDKRCVCQRGSWEKYYFNPLMCPLPKAPSLKLYCMYGHNIPTERSYSYLNLEGPEVLDTAKGEGKAERQREVLWKINAEVHEENGTLDHGIRLSDGDGTVPLISLGSLCAKHWREKKLNPSGFEVVSREYKHEPTQRNMFDIRGGGQSADHVDVLSHIDVLRDLVIIATGHGADLGDKIETNIREIAAGIPMRPS